MVRADGGGVHGGCLLMWKKKGHRLGRLFACPSDWIVKHFLNHWQWPGHNGGLPGRCRVKHFINHWQWPGHNGGLPGRGRLIFQAVIRIPEDSGAPALAVRRSGEHCDTLESNGIPDGIPWKRYRKNPQGSSLCRKGVIFEPATFPEHRLALVFREDGGAAVLRGGPKRLEPCPQPGAGRSRRWPPEPAAGPTPGYACSLPRKR